MFNTGDNRQCHTVNIVNDDECEEPAEDFFSNLELVSGVPIITVIRPEAQVFIDDTGEPECGKVSLVLLSEKDVYIAILLIQNLLLYW